MHVLVTADTVGGVWTYTRELVTGLARRGVQVTLVSFGKIPSAAQAQWLDHLPNVDFRPTAFRLEWMADASEDIALSTNYLQQVIDTVKPELLHLNQYCYGMVSPGIPRILVAHSDVVSWWAAVHGCAPEDSAWMRWYRRTVSEGLAAATQVVAITNAVRENLREHFGVGEATVIYNGRSPAWFDASVKKERAVVSVGRVWDEAKNIALLLEAKADLPVWIAGACASLEAGSTARFSSARNVVFKGELSEPELRRLYSRAAIYAATSQYEPFGLAPVEAALSGCAIVANDIPTFHELWGDDVLYCRHNDAASLRAELERLSRNAGLCVEYANRAYERARTRYNADRMVDDYVALYRSLLHTASKSAAAELGS